MDHERLDELRRRVQRARASGRVGPDDLLDTLVLLLADAPQETYEDLSQHVAEWLADRPDYWDMWIIDAKEGDYLSWQSVRALVEILWDSEPERLKDPPLLDWMVEVILGHCPEPRKPQSNPRWAPRLFRFRHRINATIVARLNNLPEGPVIWSERGDSACDLVASRLKLASEQGLLPKAYVVKPKTVYKNYLRYKQKLGKVPQWEY